eukprot:7377221-Prymnesium_polylepis.1
MCEHGELRRVVTGEMLLIISHRVATGMWLRDALCARRLDLDLTEGRFDCVGAGWAEAQHCQRHHRVSVDHDEVGLPAQHPTSDVGLRWESGQAKGSCRTQLESPVRYRRTCVRVVIARCGEEVRHKKLSPRGFAPRSILNAQNIGG